MTKHWKPILIIGLIAAAVMYLYPTVQFYGLSSAERTLMEDVSPERLADLHRRSLKLTAQEVQICQLIQKILNFFESRVVSCSGTSRSSGQVRWKADNFLLNLKKNPDEKYFFIMENFDFENFKKMKNIFWEIFKFYIGKIFFPM